MADLGENEIQDLRYLRDNLPEDERKGNLGRILSYILDVGISGWNFHKAKTSVNYLTSTGQHLKEIQNILQRMTDDGKEAILDALKYQKQNCSQEMNDKCFLQCGASLEELWENVAKGKIEAHEKTKQLILTSIENYHRQECNRVIQNMVQTSAFVAAFQLVKIYVAWKKISAASNVIEDRNKFDLITKNIKKMEIMVEQLLGVYEGNPNDDSIGRRVMRINTLFTTTLAKISDVRVQINGHMQQLDLLSDYSAVDGVTNFITAGTQGFQVWHAWGNLTSFSKFIGLASVTAFIALGASNVGVFYLSREKLAELRKELNEVIRLQENLQDLHDQVAQVIND